MGSTTASPTSNRNRAADAPSASASSPGSTRQSLKSRILSRALLISILPLLLLGTIALSSLVGLSRSAERNLDASREGLAREVVGRTVRTEALGVAQELDRAIGERVDDVIELSKSPSVRDAASAASQEGDTLVIRPTTELESDFDRRRRLAAGSTADRYLRSVTQRQPQFSELFLTERNGLAVAASARTSDFVQSDETWWNRAWEDGLHLGDVERDDSSDAIGLTVAARIDAAGGSERLGVIKGVVQLDELQRIATRVARDTGSDITLLTRDGQLLAETSSEHSASRIMNPDIEFDEERAETVTGALESQEPGFVLAERAVAGFAPLAAVDGRLASLIDDYDDIDSAAVQWVTIVEQPNDIAFAPLSGLSNVQQGLSRTARTFGIVMLIVMLIAVLAAFIVSTRLAQRIVEPLRSLGSTARDIADTQLPMLVHRAQTRPSDDDAPPQLPAVELQTNDEIEEVADAFNIVSGTAAELASDQARSRRNVSRMFVSLGRRNQNLLNRQLEFIDKLERDTSDADLLDDLFRLDHLATRMRRNAESLLVLAGEEPARRWSEPVSLTSVVRGAIAEVEDYRRVNLEGVDEAQLAGSAVGDVTHLIAELIENAAQFSPPDTSVLVVGRRVVDGYALAIVDDGVGMSPEQLDDANHRIETSPQVDRVPSSFLGLFVVGRLAARHGIRVRLMESTTEGITAKVLLPAALIDAMTRGPSNELPAGRAPALAAGEGAEHDERRAHRRAQTADERRGDDARPDRRAPVPSGARAADTSGADEPAGDDGPGPDGGSDTTTPPFGRVDIDLDAPPRRREDGAGAYGPDAYDDRRDVPWSWADHDLDAGARRDELADGDTGEIRGVGSDGDADVGSAGDESDVWRSDDWRPGSDAPDGRGDADQRPWDTAPEYDDVSTASVWDTSAWTKADVAQDAGAQPPHEEAPSGYARAAYDRDAGASTDGEFHDGVGRDERDVWAPDDATAGDAGVGGAGDRDADQQDADAAWTEHEAAGDEPDADASGRSDDDQPADDPDAVPAFEVRRRTSRRDGNGRPANGQPPAGRAMLRTEPPASDGPVQTSDEPAAPPRRAPSRATAYADTDDNGVTLTTAERDARAARDRLARFQQAVQRGRSEARRQHDGGEHGDA
jgi:signal transduction histidine kinase